MQFFVAHFNEVHWGIQASQEGSAQGNEGVWKWHHWKPSRKPSCLTVDKEDLIQTREGCHLVMMNFFCLTSEGKIRMEITNTP